MAETVALDGAPQTPETPGRYRDMYVGLVNTTDYRLERISKHVLRNVAYVQFDLEDEDISLSGLTVYRREKNGILPVTFREPSFEETVRLQRDGTIASLPPESSMLTEFALDLERRLEILDHAPATATEITRHGL